MSTMAVIADIHGCAPALERCLCQLEPAQPDIYLLLGDLLNHGPRNPVPEGYAPARVADILNVLKNKVIAVRGNCDSEVDQMLLEFPCLSPCNYLVLNGRRLCMTHGHIYKREQLALAEGDILLSGHTHIPVLEQQQGITLINPGSITFPRNGATPSYGLWKNNTWQIINLYDGKPMLSLAMPGVW